VIFLEIAAERDQVRRSDGRMSGAEQADIGARNAVVEQRCDDTQRGGDGERVAHQRSPDRRAR
jgi:hypothetical protein